MSRVGKKIILVPDGVTVTVSEREVRVDGPKGKLSMEMDPSFELKRDGKNIVLSIREGSGPEAPMRHGLTRSLLANMVTGVSQGFTRLLEINGVGYRAAVKGNALEMALGFSHPISYEIPEGISVLVEKLTYLTVSGANRQLVGQTAAEIRNFRLPEPYKGKGIKYSDETVRRKAGKAAGAAAGGAGAAK